MAEPRTQVHASIAELIFERAPIGIYTVDTQGIIDSLNPKFLEINGASKAEDVLGLNVFKLPSYHEFGLDEYIRSGLSGKPFEVELQHVSQFAKKMTWRRYRGMPIFEESGIKVTHLLLLVEDISQEKKLENDLQAYTKGLEKNISLIYNNISEVLFYVEVSPDQIYRYLSVNSAFTEAVGKSKEEIIGKRIEEVLPKSSQELFLQKMKEAVASGNTVRFESVFEYRSGSRFGDVALTPVCLDNATCTNLIGLIYDVTARKEAEHALKQRTEEAQQANELLQKQSADLRTALERVSTFAAKTDEQKTLYELMLASIGDAVVVADAKGMITVLNKAAETLLSLPTADLVGKPVAEMVRFIKKDEKEPMQEVWQEVKAATAPVYLQLDMNVLDSHNTPIPVSAILSPIINKLQEHTGTIVTLRDIREQRQLEETRISFISVASHQLRTPLTSMRWFSEMLLGGDAGAITQDQKHFIERIYQGTDRMINLVNLLLQIARVEARRLKVQPVPADLQQVTKGVALSLKATLDEKKQTVTVGAEPPDFPLIPIDQDIIWQVIQNLISNASRYSPEGAEIKIHLALRGNEVVYSVADKGIGIPEKEKPKIFEKFYRAENALRAVPEGSGLGLSLVKSLVEGWQGKIWFESQEGKGATFFFTIPITGMQKREGEVSIAV